MRGNPLRINVTEQDVHRFWQLVVRNGPDECWIYSGPTMNGYPTFKAENGQIYQAHRLVFDIEYGEVPKGLFVRRRCNNKLCCNPSHLYPGHMGGESRRTGQLNGTKPGEPILKRTHHHFTVEQVEDVRRRIAAGETQVSISKVFGCTPRCIHDIVAGKTWK
jgi:hypothetical protein